MTLQSVFKHFLTEGDRFLVSKFSQLKDQGGYAIATNYGTPMFTFRMMMMMTILNHLISYIRFTRCANRIPTD